MLPTTPCPVAYYRTGSGPDLLFIHGWPLHGQTFRQLVSRLQDRFTCHVIDLPGAGASVGQFAPIAEYPALIRGVIDQLGLTRFVGLGHDSGALFLRFAFAGDERLAGLVMGNTEIPNHIPWLLRALLIGKAIPGGRWLMWTLLGYSAVRRSGMGFGSCFEDTALADGEFFELFIAPALETPEVKQGIMNLIDQFKPELMAGLDQVHAKITAPVQLIWGPNDPWFPLEGARGMLDQFAGPATMHALQSGKLFAHEEFPDEWVAAARPFLDQCFSAASPGVAG